MKAFGKNRYTYRFIVIAIAIAIIAYLCNLYFYPQRICVGEVTQKRIWTDSTTNEQKVLDDKKKNLVISFIFKRGVIYLNEDKFPLYRELSGVNNFAEETEVGYKGGYSHYGMLDRESIFKFTFNDITSVLQTENIAKGLHYIEYQKGHDKVNIEFSGSCHRKFL